MLALLALLATQAPAEPSIRLTATGTDLSLSVTEPEGTPPRFILQNGGKARVRVMQPYFETPAGAADEKACVLWAEGNKPHALSAPADGYKRRLLFRDADFTLAPNERLELTLRCESQAAAKLTLIHVLVADAGPEKPFWMISRTTSPTVATTAP